MLAKKQLNKPFHFKQFSINHHNSTMKVGTDAILLGVWSDVNNAEYILDVGTGSGVIALLMAARSKAMVDSVELDEQSVIEARDNFTKSPFADRLAIYREDFISFAKVTKQKYDIVITNPPFFSNALLPDNQSRKAARHINGLSNDKLCDGVSRLLSKNGVFCLVLPENQSYSFIKTAKEHNLYLYRQQLVYPVSNSKPNRINMELRHNKASKVITEEIFIRDENGNHTDQYKDFTKDYLVNK